MIILYLLGIMVLIGIVDTIIYLCTHDYTKNPRTGEDIKEKIDGQLLEKNKFY